MIATGLFFILVAIVALALYIALAALLGRRLRRARKQQTRPALYVVRDEQLDISEAMRRKAGR